MNYWLMKTEPTTFSIDDLQKRKNQTEPWDGVRNYQARNMMRDDMKVGDRAFFYHSNCKVPGIVGIVEIVKKSYPDFTQFDPDSDYFDPKSDPDNPRWFLVDVKFVEKFDQVVPLSRMRENPELDTMVIMRPRCRLSVSPVTAQEWDAVLRMV